MGAIEGVIAGVFSPDTSTPPGDFASLKARLAAARDSLGALSEAHVHRLAGRAMRFEYGDFRIAFVADAFLLSFSLPNFYFHATTAYAILRAQGVPLGKSDFMGQLRTR